MKGRKQNIVRLSGQSEQREEPDAMIGMQTFMGITENHLTAFKQKEGGLLEYILSPVNLNLAYKQVKSNKGSGGVMMGIIIIINFFNVKYLKFEKVIVFINTDSHYLN